MGKSYTGQPFTLGLDPKTTKPLDARESVDALDDIYLPATWLADDGNYYVYPGMLTRVKGTGVIAVYIGEANSAADIADEDKWVLHDPSNVKVTVDTSLSSASGNPVANRAIKSALDRKVDVEEGMGLSANDFTDELKEKLEGIEEGATKGADVDTALDSSSTNPVQNKAVTEAINTNRGNIDTLQNTVNSILNNGIGDVADWTILLKEESEFEKLTSDNTVEGILYFGLEPLEEESGDTAEYDEGRVLVSSASYSGGYVLISGASYSNGHILIQ